MDCKERNPNKNRKKKSLISFWQSQGSFLSKHGDASTYGSIAGLFWAIFMVHQLLGNLFAALFFTNSASEFTFVLILSIVALVGFACWALLKNPKKFKIDATVNQPESLTNFHNFLFSLLFRMNRFVDNCQLPFVYLLNLKCYSCCHF